MSTREQIIITRRTLTETVKPHVQRITKQNQFYRDEAEQLRDAQDLQHAIAEARAERLAKEER
jgi:hypothetical protein